MKKIKYIIKKSVFLYTITTILLRFVKSITYNKYSFSEIIEERDNVFVEIYNSNFWNSNESASGGGSTIKGTKVIREELPKIISDFNIQTMLDLPCGDYNWMKEVKLNCTYLGGDLVEEVILSNQIHFSSDKINFKKIDILNDLLPCVDLIFCKDLFQHLSYENIFTALINIKNSGSKYLLVTSYPYTFKNYDILNGDFRALNLFKFPFKFKDSLYSIKEDYDYNLEGIEIDKKMYLFDLSKLYLSNN